MNRRAPITIVVSALLLCACDPSVTQPTAQLDEAAAQDDSALPSSQSREASPNEPPASALPPAESASAAPLPLDPELAKELLAKPPLDPTAQPLDDAQALEAARNCKTEPGELPRLGLMLNGERYELPLQHTHVKAKLVGGVAQIELSQRYRNPFDQAIETVYVFPLPENAAVNAMRIVIGERVIEAEIRKREEARAVYEEAKQEGHTAALLEQERPNVFTQSIANIAAGEDIEVVIGYVQSLTYDAGEYEWVFPMVVGPRFIPGSPKGRSGTGWSADTDEVPDASRLTPPVVGAGMRTGHDISLELEASMGFAIQSWSVPTHEVAVESEGGELRLALAEKESLPNRDFILRFSVAGEQPQASLLEAEGYFLLSVQPPQLELEELVGRRELIFVIDISGSMWGKPMAMCKDAASQAIRMMQAVDTFNVMVFAGNERMLWAEPRPANDNNISEAIRFVDGLNAGGGTMLSGALETALSPSVEQGRHRYVFLMTDGFVGNEDAILSLVSRFAGDDSGGKKRVFGFGVGSSVNRVLLEGVGSEGKGATVYASNREDPSLAVKRFFSMIDHPIATELSIDWGGLQVSEVYPTTLPDLLASRPVLIHGRVEGAGEGTALLRGMANGRPFALPIALRLGANDPDKASILGSLWARAKIAELSRELWDGPQAQVVEAITALGIEHRLLTAYTSFVAVDRSRRVGDGTPLQVVQPVDGAEDVSMQHAAPMSAQVGTSSGSYGLGLSGAGRGGDGSNAGGFGIGRFGTAGRGGQVFGAESESEEKATPKPKLKPGNAEVQGSLSKRIVQKVIKQHRAALKACYESALQQDPSLEGKLTVRWSVDENGVVSDVSITLDTVGSPELAACVIKTVEGMRFPKSQAGKIIITYPFEFSPSE
ncbi:MAG: VIT domain-containing protein [Myxococcota bacterium]|jgi:Ca-activated chloride channel family protein|nr:VIT domain-containing protein [Myxococcota bacterium]